MKKSHSEIANVTVNNCQCKLDLIKEKLFRENDKLQDSVLYKMGTAILRSRTMRRVQMFLSETFHIDS